MDNKTTRDRWKRLGLCHECGKRKPRPGKNSCEECFLRQKENCRKRRAAHLAQGLCYCGRATLPDSRRCQNCQANAERRIAKRKGNNLCERCGSPAETGKGKCGACAAHDNAARRERNRLLRIEALLAYGGRCEICGLTEINFLSIDHKDGGGTKHRQEIAKNASSWQFFNWLKTHNWPEGFRVLCFNHNCGKKPETPGTCLACQEPAAAPDRFFCQSCMEGEPNRRVYDGQRRLKREVIAAYGNRCECCGEAAFEFLTLEHKDGDGRKDRMKFGSGAGVYRWAKRNGFPQTLTVLCFNCNCARGYFGACPHQREHSHGPP